METIIATRNVHSHRANGTVMSNEGTMVSEWERVKKSLTSGHTPYRAAETIAQETDLSTDRVIEILRAHSAEVRISPAQDKKGRLLYTLKLTPKSLTEHMAQWRAYILKEPLPSL